MSRLSPLAWCRRAWTDLPLRHKGLVVSLIPVIPLVMTALLYYQSGQQERAAQEVVIRTVDARAELDATLSLLAEAEIGVRDYLLTRNPRSLDPHEEALRRLPETLALLQAHFTNQGQIDRLRRFRLLVQRRLDVLHTMLGQVGRAGEPPISRDLLAEDRMLMERVRAELATMRAVQDGLLVERRGRVRYAQQWLLVVIVGGTVAGAVGGVLAARRFISNMLLRVAQLQENARQLTEGHHELASIPGRDEIGELGQALEKASALLASREQALRDAGEELDRFFSSSLDLFCIADFNGYFLRVNSAWTYTLGWTAEEMMTRPYVEFVHPDDRGGTAQESMNLTAGVPTMTFVNRYLTKTNSYRWLEWRAMPVSERGLVYAGARDITDQKAAEALVLEARDAADRANRAKSEFLSRMSHDLRTPLNSVLGFAQLLESDRLEPAQQESVKQILKGGRHLLDLINDVLDLVRVESGRLALSPEPVAVRDVVQEALDLVRPLAASRDITLEVDSGVLDDYVIADRQRMNQVLHNLLSNAIKYNRLGGRVSVSTQHQSGGRLRISVNDTGMGLRQEQLGRLFQPFERLGAEQTATDGTGLGLVSAKGLVEAMGGTIGVASQVHHGSTFWIELPRTHEPTNQVTNTDNDWRETPGTVGLVGTVLYVEDNASNRVLMERILARRPGVRLLTAATGAVGLEVARTQVPDLILLDVHLPDILGDDVLRQLWADPVTRQIPVSVLSADATPGQIRRLLSAGARAYLTKPLDVEKVLSLVDGTLAEPSEAEVDLARGAHVRD